ncbi:hypothetical protein [Arcticibacter tournemirensis]
MKTSFLKAGALVMGALIAVSGTAFKRERRVQVWAYHGDSQSQVTDASKYTLNGAPADDCGDDGNMPCQITVSNDITTQAQLQSFLNGKTAEQVLAISNGRRPE